MGEVTLHVPAEHVELFRLAALYEVGSDADWVKSMQEEIAGRLETGRPDKRPTDLYNSKRHLDDTVRLVDQLFDAAADEAVEVRAGASTLAYVGEDLIRRIVLPKLTSAAAAGPMDEGAAGELTALADAIRWAASWVPGLHDRAVVAENRAEVA